MKPLLHFILPLILFSCAGRQDDKSIPALQGVTKQDTYLTTIAPKVLNKKIIDTKGFLARHREYNNKTAFLVDMHIPSNRYRFFVVDLIKNTVIKKGLVAHGIGSAANEKGAMVFSNEPGSSCTSLGRYAIRESYSGRFGKAYRLSGMEKTNNKALERSVVLHQYRLVPDTEQDNPICYSLGCPMVSPQFFSQIEDIIDNSPGKMLLLIYY